VQQELDLTFSESIEWVENFFQLGKHKGFGRPKKIEHKPREIKKKEIDINEKLPQYNESILNTFYDYKPIEWLNEGISKETMDLFGIKFDINTNAIIIPHRDMDGRLIGIRCRNLSEDRIEQYGKYIPYTDIFSNITYKHKITMNLYGLYENKDNIIKKKTAILFESEKSTELMNSYYPDDSIAVSLGCSSISNFQIELLKLLGVETVIVCFDYEIREKLLKKFEKNYKKCALHFNTYVLDSNLMGQLLEESDSPVDKGKEIFEQLLWNKIKYELEV
jgi:DNA primase